MMETGSGKYGIRGFSVSDKKEFVEWYEEKSDRDKVYKVFKNNRYYKDLIKVEK
jgi:hypothetical protein